MTNFINFLKPPEDLQIPFQPLCQEILELDQKGEISTTPEINVLCKKVHAFARSVIESPISPFYEESYEIDFVPALTETSNFKTTMQSWNRLSSIAALTSEQDLQLRLRYLIGSLQFHQRQAQNDQVSQALVRLHQRRLSLHTSPLVTKIQDLEALLFQPTATTSSYFPFYTKQGLSLDNAYKCVLQLFNSCNLIDAPFFFSEYWNRFCNKLSVKEQSQFLTALLYRFFLKDIDIPSTKVCVTLHPLEVFCWQILAENISENTILSLVNQLTWDQKVRLASLALAHYREGSFFIVNALLQANDSDLVALIHLCQREHGNSALIAKEVQSLPLIDPLSLRTLIEKHEAALVEKAAAIARRMNALLPLIVELPQTRKEGCYLMRKQHGLEPASSEEEAIHFQFLQEKGMIDSLFFAMQETSSSTATCIAFDHTDCLRLLQTFGFSHLRLPAGHGVAPNLTFPDALDALITVYSNPLSSYKIHPQALKAQLYYLSNFFAHTQALRTPRGYAKGASTTIFSLPTCGKELSRLSWLPSMAENLRAYCASTGSLIHDHPIFVFDQSQKPLYFRNLKYIEELNARYGTRITVYSNEQILKLSDKLNLGQLIDTSKKGRLGYGGARNAVYMFSPILKELDRIGYHTPKDVLCAPTDLLRKIFFKTLSSNQWTIHMGDDDAQIPYAYYLSDLLLAQNHHGSSFVKCGEFSGRDTRHINGIRFDEIFDLEKILAAPEILFEQTLWSKEKRRWGMCGALRSFGWSMLPFGSEETYNAEELQIGADIRPSGFHLAGRRFPTTPLPSSPIIGTANRLTSYLPYLLETILIVDLIEPTNKTQRTILPWKQLRSSSLTFANLGSVLNTLSSIATEKAMRKQLLKNYWEQHKHPTLHSVFRSLWLIANHDINGSISNYLQTHPNTSHEELQELEQCRMVFEKFQEDAKAFFLFNQTFFNHFPLSGTSDAWIDAATEQDTPWKLVLFACKEKVESSLGKPISDHSITSSLLLLLETIVSGELYESVRVALHQRE